MSSSTPIAKGPFPSREPPDSMTPAARLAEVAEILARGFIRLLKSREESTNPLDESGEHEAPCSSVVDGNGAETGEEKVA